MSKSADARGWEELAGEDPYWAILSQPDRRFQGWDIGEFLATGEQQIAELLDRAARLGLPARHDIALDYGCGAGRLTRALAGRFERVVGLDISPRMVAIARRLNSDVPGCGFETAGARPLPHAGGYDLVCSLLVLQHVPRRSERHALMRGMVASLRGNGLLVVQLTSHIPLRHRLQLRPRLYRALRAVRVPSAVLYRRMGLHPIRMASIPPETVDALLGREGARVVDRIESTTSGVLSTTYFVIKNA